jgi:hypothetical protein
MHNALPIDIQHKFSTIQKLPTAGSFTVARARTLFSDVTVVLDAPFTDHIENTNVTVNRTRF